jgi:hypothetical protein
MMSKYSNLLFLLFSLNAPVFSQINTGKYSNGNETITFNND